MLKHSFRVGVVAATLAALSARLRRRTWCKMRLQLARRCYRDIAEYWEHVHHWLERIPRGRLLRVHSGGDSTPDQTWQCCLTGSAGPGYGIDNGMVGPPSGNASVVIDGTYGFVPHRLWLILNRQSPG